MKQTISVQINVNKIDKNRLYKGDKGVYMNAVILLNDEPDQYDQNGMVIQSVSKEEREQGVKGNILGNVKILGGAQSQNPTPDPAEDIDDDLPF